MTNHKTRPVATRVTIDELAKVRDALLIKGIPSDQLSTISSILKSALLVTTLITPEPLAPASPESIAFINQLWNQPKTTSKVKLEDII